MRKIEKGRRGMAAVEFALLLPVLALLILLLMQGGNAMHTYSALVEASREGARHVVTAGDSADVAALVAAVVADLDPDKLSTNVTTDTLDNTVTVEVSYVYDIFGSQSGNALFGKDEPLTLVAQTTMPLP
ncbi:TadE/TadG family type IV pilus assembly protein [Desulfovibrio sp. Huiquan2017]|uniref:TadE/TadG family type IV pilus assembly protein n=1 Tax=Desulfovibrio sp. Huiquan2017 TaxID=2816861 RepID=UPI001A90DBB7|nr:TadE/TadG family type IV pilus assembly protein [Desulfovibrio sp. Huiquan2017]